VLVLADTRNVNAVFGAPQSLVESLELCSPIKAFAGTDSEPKTPEKLLDARVTGIAPAADASGRVFARRCPSSARLPPEHRSKTKGNRPHASCDSASA
jgi:hypothetical protein